MFPGTHWALEPGSPVGRIEPCRESSILGAVAEAATIAQAKVQVFIGEVFEEGKCSTKRLGGVVFFGAQHFRF
jgi:hypothetical protein